MSSTSTAAMILRLVLSLAVVLALMVGAARLLQRTGGLRTVRGSGADVQVLARQGLGKHASVAVLAVGGRALVVGIGDHGVRLLSDLDLDDVAPAAAPDDDPTTRPTTSPAPIGGALGLLVRRTGPGSGTPRRSTRDSALATVRDWTVRRPRA